MAKRRDTEPLTDEDRDLAERHCLRWKQVLDDKWRFWHRIGQREAAASRDLDDLYRLILGYVKRSESSARLDAFLTKRHGSRTVLGRRNFAKQLLDAWLVHGADIDALLDSEDRDVVKYVADSLYLDEGMLISALRSEVVRAEVSPSEREKKRVTIPPPDSFRSSAPVTAVREPTSEIGRVSGL